MRKIVVVDAQGGGLGAAIVKKLCERYAGKIDLFAAVGTNAAATAAMKKSGAAHCATGEAAVCLHAKTADVIMGGIGIISAAGMLGEITPRIARAIAESPAQKILIPFSKCHILVPGVAQVSAGELIGMAADMLGTMISQAP